MIKLIILALVRLKKSLMNTKAKKLPSSFITQTDVLTARDIIAWIKSCLSEENRRSVVIVSFATIRLELEEELARQVENRQLNEILNLLEGEGIVLAIINDNGEIEAEDGLKIIKTQETDQALLSLLNRNNGRLAVKK